MQILTRTIHVLSVIVLFTQAHAFAATGFLKVTSTPDGVDVYVDGTHRGRTPCSVELPMGRHDVSCRKAGFGAASKQVTIEADEIQDIEVRLKPASSSGYVDDDRMTITQDTGTVVIISVERNCEVLWDGSSWGETPISRRGVPAGRHVVRAMGNQMNVELRKNQRLRLQVTATGIIDIKEEAKRKRLAEQAAAQRRAAKERKAEKQRLQEARASALRSFLGAWEITGYDGYGNVEGYMELSQEGPNTVRIVRGYSSETIEHVGRFTRDGSGIEFSYRYKARGTRVSYGSDRFGSRHVLTWQVKGTIRLQQAGTMLRMVLDKRDVVFPGNSESETYVFSRINRAQLPWRRGVQDHRP